MVRSTRNHNLGIGGIQRREKPAVCGHWGSHCVHATPPSSDTGVLVPSRACPRALPCPPCTCYQLPEAFRRKFLAQASVITVVAFKLQPIRSASKSLSQACLRDWHYQNIWMLWFPLILAALQLQHSIATVRTTLNVKGWESDTEFSAPRCTVERIPIDAITKEEFDLYFLEQSPVILLGTDQHRLSALTVKVHLPPNIRDHLSGASTITHITQDVFTAGCKAARWSCLRVPQHQLLQLQGTLLRSHGDSKVRLSSANTFSHGYKYISLREYLHTLSSPSTGVRANESFYLFGPHADLSPSLSKLVETYVPPVFAGSDLAFSFGIGGHASGIPFHVHGHGFSEVIHGKKVRQSSCH
jgi:hypothetical protein